MGTMPSHQVLVRVGQLRLPMPKRKGNQAVTISLEAYMMRRWNAVVCDVMMHTASSHRRLMLQPAFAEDHGAVTTVVVPEWSLTILHDFTSDYIQSSISIAHRNVAKAILNVLHAVLEGLGRGCTVCKMPQ